jgi:hypothetical protein
MPGTMHAKNKMSTTVYSTVDARRYSSSMSANAETLKTRLSKFQTTFVSQVRVGLDMGTVRVTFAVLHIDIATYIHVKTHRPSLKHLTLELTL